MSRMLISVPEKSFEGYKRDILTTWFHGTPTLVSYPELTKEGRSYASFYADSPIDINTAVAKLPVDGIAFLFDEVW